MGLTVAILGDSVMWGQGVTADHQFARRAAKEIAGDGVPITVLPGLGEEPRRGFPRSGAKINAGGAEGDPQRVLLPGGDLATAPPGDRTNFARTFRSLFASDAEMRAFLAGAEGERVAARLYGENPATFPTVRGQLAMAGAPDPAVGLVIVNGGANDVEFEEVLDPTGPTPAAITRAIDKVFGTALRDLLGDVRQQFPAAVIIVPGYYSALSGNSASGDLRTLFEFMSKRPEWQLTANNAIQSVPGLRDIFEAMGLSQDVDALVRSAVRRSIAAAAYTHYRTRRTIAALPGTVRRPGLFYVHPGFRAEHALFAGGETLVHSGYRFPGEDRLSVADEMRAVRHDRIPRHDLHDGYRDLARRTELVIAAMVLQSAPASTAEPLRREVVEFVAAHPDVPSGIVMFTRDTHPPTVERLRDLLADLQAEIGRIETAFIASFVHPNTAGALRYSDRIVAAHRRFQRYSLRGECGRMMPDGGPISLRRAFQRRGGDLATEVRQLAGVTFVESVAVSLEGLPSVPPLSGGLTRRMTLTFGAAVSVSLLVPAGIVPGIPVSTTFAADLPRELHLGGVERFTVAGAPPFTGIVFHLNGREFLRRRFTDGQTHDDVVEFSLQLTSEPADGPGR